MALHGAYQMQLSTRYALRLPDEWRTAFIDRTAIICFSENHWKIYPAKEWAKWVTIMTGMYKTSVTPLPAEVRRCMASALPVLIRKTGEVVIPKRLRLLSPGQVEIMIMGLASFIEIWPVEAWRVQMEKDKDAAVGITKAELMKIFGALSPVYIDLPRSPRDS